MGVTGKPVRPMLFIMALLICAFALLIPLTALSDDGENSGAQGTGFTGKLTISGEGIAGARVYAYRTFADYRNSNPAFVSAPSEPDGRYTIETAPGNYFLAAKKLKGTGPDAPPGDGDLFSFHGSNPLLSATGKFVHVGFSLLPFSAGVEYLPYEDGASGALKGRVTFEGAPVEGAFVTLYVDTAEDLRGSSYASSPATGVTGAFAFEYLPGLDYYVVARKRASGKPAGPLADGDLFGFFPANPVHVKEGNTASIEIPVTKKSGEITGGEGAPAAVGARITGRVLDRFGKPVAGVYVFAYLEKVMAHKRPEALSRAVDAEGYYSLDLKGGGTYYIGARANYGDSPSIGEWYGRWEGTADHSLNVKTGQTLDRIDITVEKILP